ncbi:hypothetical protein SASPL_107965 [Salvia splendens]|uniref:Uncharacterized protein n=1 Tax=Salvia splendens TaxID=180675 RepID=A0A8X8YC78_SALSN|nr:hypothetical protein SASPL_107965 [Salvia splendens]
MPPRSARLGSIVMKCFGCEKSGTNATLVVDPIGEPKATIVWLHSLNEDGSIVNISSWILFCTWKSNLLQINLPNVSTYNNAICSKASCFSIKIELYDKDKMDMPAQLLQLAPFPE